jgi:desulfoferrodoxin (superoxide reductase-like protein)
MTLSNNVVVSLFLACLAFMIIHDHNLVVIVDGFVLTPTMTQPPPTARRSDSSSSTCHVHVHSNHQVRDDEDDEGGNFINTGDLLLDRRLALVRTVAMTAAAGATVSAVTSPSQPANAIGRVELSINSIQTDSEIVASKNTNGDPIKHTPVVTLEKDGRGYGQILTVEIPHVMDFDKPHYIEYVWLQDVTANPNDVRLGKIVAAEAFTKPRGKSAGVPVVAKIQTKVASGTLPTKGAYLTKNMIVKPCLYCNLHGLWEGEPISLSG